MAMPRNFINNMERMGLGNSSNVMKTMKDENDCFEELQRIGLRISYFRRVRGMTQAALAESLHINKNYLSHIECGVGKAISLPLLIRISKALNVKLSVLVDLEDWTGDTEKDSEAVAIQELREMMKEMSRMNADIDRMMAQMDDWENGDDDYAVEGEKEDAYTENPCTEFEAPSHIPCPETDSAESSSVIDLPAWMRAKETKS